MSDLRTIEVIDQALVDQCESEVPRGHLGLSGIAEPDIRTQWLKFRWSLPDTPPGRTLRIFNMGNMVEDEVVRILKVAGFDVWEVDPDTGKQFNFKFFGGHFAGSADGVVRGIPETEKPLLLEIKSAKSSKFKELQKFRKESLNDNEALQKWNKSYYGQVQCYMPNLGLGLSLFVVYNKDTSELITMIIEPEKYFWEGMKETGLRILEATAPPASTFPNRNWFEIKKYKSEEYQRVYWGDQLPEPNCRNCLFAEPVLDEDRVDAAWRCKFLDCERSLEQQCKGCPDHLFIREMVPAEHVQDHIQDGAIEYKTFDGERFFNASQMDFAKTIFTSKELAEVSKQGLTKDTLFDPITSELREEFHGRIISVKEV